MAPRARPGARRRAEDANAVGRRCAESAEKPDHAVALGVGSPAIALAHDRLPRIARSPLSGGVVRRCSAARDARAGTHGVAATLTARVASRRPRYRQLPAAHGLPDRRPRRDHRHATQGVPHADEPGQRKPRAHRATRVVAGAGETGLWSRPSSLARGSTVLGHTATGAGGQGHRC